MKKILTIFSVCAICLVSGSAYADQTYDFADVAKPFVTFPFQVTRVDETGEGFALRHTYHVADAYDDVVKTLSALFASGAQIDHFVPIGFNEQSGDYYQLLFGYRNEHHYAQIRREGSGCVIDVEAMPSSFVLGTYDTSVNDYVLPDGSQLSSFLYAEE